MTKKFSLQNNDVGESWKTKNLEILYFDTCLLVRFIDRITRGTTNQIHLKYGRYEFEKCCYKDSV